jgi:serine/threonine protein kinase
MPIIRGLCLGLAYAHNKNIIHSDFKPGNIYLTESDQTKILDFGIARAAPTDRVEASETTQFDAGELGALTPSYAACEMFEGKDPHPADDVYALAIVAYQLLSGQHPFDSRPAPQARQLDLEPKPIKGLRRREWRALKRGLAFDRAERSQHAAEFLRDLEGGSRLKMVVGIAVTLAVIFAGYVGYVQFQERVRNAPDIPFESLPQTTQVELGRLLEEGDIFVRFGDSGSALALFREAYQLHPRNKQVVERLELLFSNLSDQAAAQSERAGLERLQENLDSVMAIDDFLGNRPSLIKARDKVANALVQ